MRSLSFEDFSFPFANPTKVREALKLQVMPYSAAGELELFPVVLSRQGRGVKGIVWYVSPEELNIPSSSYDSSGLNKIWPAPLPFISQLNVYNGSGVTMWIDERNICSILWQENKPVLYRWRRVSGVNDPESKELSWYDAYCKERVLDRGGNFIVNMAENENNDEENNYDFQEIINSSVKICPWISNVNLSRMALEGAMGLERNVRFLTRASCWLLVLGVITLGGSLLRWYQIDEQVRAVRTESEKFYRDVFDKEHTGRVSNPVSLAREKIAALTGGGPVSHGLDEVLADLGDIFTDYAGMRNVTVDVIRYNSEGLDCTGSAPDMTTVLNFRKAWESLASLAQLDNTQSVSGIGYRFDLRIRW